MLSRVFITAGGIGTILAVVTVCVFLISVAIPLFQSGSVTSEKRLTTPWPSENPLHVGMDDEQQTAWALFPDGRVSYFRLDNGDMLSRPQLLDGPALTAVSFPAKAEQIAFGFKDGSVRFGTIAIKSGVISASDASDALRDLPAGQVAAFRGGLLSRTADGEFHLKELAVDIKPAAKSESPSPVVRIDQSILANNERVICTVSENGAIRLNSVRERGFQPGKKTYVLSGVDVPYTAPQGEGRPDHLLLSQLGDQIYLIWNDGRAVRYDARGRDKNPPDIHVTEERNLLDKAGAHLTAVQYLIGKNTILVGDSDGKVRAWTTPRTEGTDTPDGLKMTAIHELPGPAAAVSSLGVSDRERLVSVGYADGSIRIYKVTAEKLIVDLHPANAEPVETIALAPKDDGVLASTATQVWHAAIDPKYPEATVGSLFGKVWYEGYEKPEYVWQSSSGDDAFEAKYSLIPLIFGTLKAAFYSLLFGVPIALLAAVYTSEYLHPRVKAAVKPTIELMASLPSVVLGFLAGLVFAQFVESVLPAVLTAFLAVPFAFVLGAHLWQLLPEKVGLAMQRWRFPAIFLALPIGLLGGVYLGPVVERLLFGGDFRGWLNGGAGSGTGGWMLLFLPLCAVLAFVAVDRVVNPWLLRKLRGWSRTRTALLDLGKLAVVLVATVGIALAISFGLSACGFDPRGSFVGSFTQRNALVVGFTMGFAIIPIIYTLADDALTAVPEHLRSGSLACGATRWQTAMRIVVPTAMSGLFSAVMIGMGRAVGETMIVLMATGNTPVMNWNMFSGFRTLSANIAVELPEAVKDSTHYRILYLSALCLFALTFVLNTIAEAVRQRFRRKAYQL